MVFVSIVACSSVVLLSWQLFWGCKHSVAYKQTFSIKITKESPSKTHNDPSICHQVVLSKLNLMRLAAAHQPGNHRTEEVLHKSGSQRSRSTWFYTLKNSNYPTHPLNHGLLKWRHKKLSMPMSWLLCGKSAECSVFC